jgi:type IV secretory pathway VirB6-like protein
MKHVAFQAPLAAALGLFLMTAAALIALADPPGYYFQDPDMQPSLNAAGAPARVAADPSAAAVDQQNALATAQQAEQLARQAEQLAQRAFHQAQQAVLEAQQR